jgi:hypothetical protein
MILKGAIGLLVAGLICYAVYLFTSKPNYDEVFELGESSLHAKVNSSEIYPKSAYTNNTLKIKMQKALKEEYLYIAVKWFRNGQQIYNYNEPELLSSKFSKGDQIHAEVNLLGPDEMDQPVVTLPVTILNTPPQIIEASAVLESGSSSGAIRARVNAMDADKDRIRYRYAWYINDRQLPGETKATLDVGLCKKGDEVYAEIVAMDGDDESPPFKSEPVRIGGNVLKITSQPPKSIGEDRRYVYQVATEAPDPEALMFSLVSSPTGMTISKTGRVEWQLPDPKLGTQAYEVVIRVADPTGTEVFQEFAINVTGTSKK